MTIYGAFIKREISYQIMFLVKNKLVKFYVENAQAPKRGAQWLDGRVLDENDR